MSITTAGTHCLKQPKEATHKSKQDHQEVIEIRMQVSKRFKGQLC